jgi:hypothetical protein
MRRLIHTGGALLVALAVSGALTSAAAQVAVTSADIQRLQDRIYDAGGEIARLRAQNAELASRLQLELDELREEVIYLKVKMRKEGSVLRAEYAALRDKIDDLAARARRQSGLTPESAGSTAPMGGVSGGVSGGVATGTAGGVAGGVSTGVEGTRTRQSGARRMVPVGTELDVRLQTELNSDTAQVEDRFEATTVVDLSVGDEVVIPAGSVVRGVVTAVDDADRIDRKGRLSLSFDQITVRGRNYPIRATVTQAIESEGIKGEAARIGAGAGVGAIIGGILGGFKGALAGILIGGGGVVAATEGKDVVLPPGTVLRIRLDSALELR